jgi:hypothetical protein
MSESRAGQQPVSVAVARCYKDAIRHGSHRFRRRYHGDAEGVELGRVVFVVQKTLSENRDPYHAPAFTDDAATVLPVGTPVHEVAGYPADQCLAAYRDGVLQLYDRVVG